MAAAEGARRLERLVLRERASGGQELVDGAALFVMIGATPHTGWLPDSILRDDRGFIRTGPDLLSDPPRANWPLDRPPLALEASLPGYSPSATSGPGR